MTFFPPFYLREWRNGRRLKWQLYRLGDKIQFEYADTVWTKEVSEEDLKGYESVGMMNFSFNIKSTEEE